MEVPCFIAEWLKVNSPNRWVSPKTNLNFKRSSFIFPSQGKSENNSPRSGEKVVFYNTTSPGSLGHSKQFITLRPFSHINVTINAHRFLLKLSIGSEAERGVGDWGISEKGTDTREGGEGRGGEKGEAESGGRGRTGTCRWGSTEMERWEAVAGQQHPQTCHFL